MVSDGDCVAIFNSVHRVMKAEKLLKAVSLDVLLIPVPRQLSSDCGLAIRFRVALQAELETTLTKAGLDDVEIWCKLDGVLTKLV